MRIARPFAVVLTALTACLLATQVIAGALAPAPGPATPNAATVTYDPANGNLSYAGNGTSITTIELISASNMFIPANLDPGVPRGPFDIFTAGKFFQLITAGTDSVNFGPVLPAGLSCQAIVDDIAADGSIKPSGKLDAAPGGGPYVYCVPEPSSIALVCYGLLGILVLGRKSQPHQRPISFTHTGYGGERKRC
jgi:hypothetical protein